VHSTRPATATAAPTPSVQLNTPMPIQVMVPVWPPLWRSCATPASLRSTMDLDVILRVIHSSAVKAIHPATQTVAPTRFALRHSPLFMGQRRLTHGHLSTFFVPLTLSRLIMALLAGPSVIHCNAVAPTQPATAIAAPTVTVQHCSLMPTQPMELLCPPLWPSYVPMISLPSTMVLDATQCVMI